MHCPQRAAHAARQWRRQGSFFVRNQLSKLREYLSVVAAAMKKFIIGIALSRFG
jgi:hypothetical protein